MVMRGVLTSPRRQRRALRLAVAVAALAAMGGFLVAFSDEEPPEPVLRPGGQLVVTPEEVPLTAADRREIDALLDRFVPEAVKRQNPLAAYQLVTPALRSVASREDWRRGVLPVAPFDAQGKSFHHWQLRFSYRNEANVDLILRAGPEAPVSAVATNIHLRRLSGRWLVDAFTIDATYARADEPARMFAQPDVAPAARQDLNTDEPRLGPVWFALPLGIVVVPLLALLAVYLAKGVLARRTPQAG
jgi:hypothetical protein